ncbi:MAG TPA: hypothetical protein VK904_00170 [Miltoncostaeaceae bacterium]|nr:hypothetical protein [Miltoncostaeaceae bacterium]
MICAPGPSSASPAERRADARTLRLKGSTTYACRGCRNGIRVVSAWYLPDSCPACGASTWTEGRCSCSAGRRPGVHGHAFCHACGDGIWVRVGRDAP